MATVVRWHGHAQNVMIHRLVWKWVTGEEPGVTIDHINRQRSDNRFWNLRIADWVTQMNNRADNFNKQAWIERCPSSKA